MNVDGLANIFDKNIEESLNEIFPYKVFTVKSYYKFGISEGTKKLMEQRDKARIEVSRSKGSEKIVMVAKYNIVPIYHIKVFFHLR